MTEPNHTIKQNLIGRNFGRLTVLTLAEINKWGQAVWDCMCECGTRKPVRGGHLVQGKTKSCGCLNAEMARNRLKTHGQRDSDIYNCWGHMKSRCYNPNVSEFRHYGGRGIVVCDRWLNSFENFLADMGEKPSPSHSIERKNVNGNYEPSNCVWATSKQQQNNRRNNHLLTHAGVTLTIAQWSNRTGLKSSVLSARISAGWSIESAITAPSRATEKHRQAYQRRYLAENPRDGQRELL